MFLKILILLLAFHQLVIIGNGAACIANEYLSTFDIVSPKPNELVTNPYYTRLSAEVVSEIDLFKKKQKEFQLCARVTAVENGKMVELFKECNRSVFGQGSVPGFPGTNTLEITLYHLHTKLCEMTISVECCVDADLAASLLQIQRAEKVRDFVVMSKEVLREHTTNQELNTNENLGNRANSKKLMPRLLRNAPPTESKTSSYSDNGVVNILIGIKSAALNIHKRENIRNSWFRSLLSANSAAEGYLGPHQYNLMPYFLVGNSTLGERTEEDSGTGSSGLSEENERAKQLHADLNEVQNLLLQEQAVFKDMLLTAELPVTDSYLKLGEKVLHFLQWAFGYSGTDKEAAECTKDDRQEAKVDFVVMCDDDVYVDIWQLIQLLERQLASNDFYTGEVKQCIFHCCCVISLCM
jgi:hypothetical protein